MSTPAYPEKQAFVAHLVRALETSNPDFAWIQFLFVRSDYRAALVRLKNSIHAPKIAIEQPSVDLVSGQERGQEGAPPGLLQAGRLEDEEGGRHRDETHDHHGDPGDVGERRESRARPTPSPSTTAPTSTTASRSSSTATRGCSSSSSTGGWSLDIS